MNIYFNFALFKNLQKLWDRTSFSNLFKSPITLKCWILNFFEYWSILVLNFIVNSNRRRYLKQVLADVYHQASVWNYTSYLTLNLVVVLNNLLFQYTHFHRYLILVVVCNFHIQSFGCNAMSEIIFLYDTMTSLLRMDPLSFATAVTSS